jgi:DNA-binding NtrC family response regulator
MEGVEVCHKILEINPNTKIIFITAYATVQYAVEAMQAGAFHYLSKPFELDELSITIDMALKNVHLEGKLRVQDYERQKEKQEKKLIGSSEVMKRIREQIELASGSEATVLITGETGVGKNVVATAIHDLQVKRETFLAINCSAIPENLMEAEYFGHEKGVFTGAETRREGIFELADGGTLVLDEIGEIPLHLQSKLLTALEDKSIRRIGSGRAIPIDVRVIATTNEDLEEAIREKRFRQDLYYRLAVLNIHIPPLREHSEDIPEIADYFVKQLCRKPTNIPDNHMKKLMRYPWPGNVRELRNVIERAALLLQGDEIKPAELLLQSSLSPPLAASGRVSMNINEILPLEEMKRRHILSALRACSDNKSLTARSLGISLSTLKRKLKEMKIS